MKKTAFQTILLILLSSMYSFSQQSEFQTLLKFRCPEAHQGIAVDNHAIYAISTKKIAKYDKTTHKLLKSWQSSEQEPIIHLDSGVIIDGKLYAAHSNYPGIPMTSSIEIWDTETLEHIGSHSFGIKWGSCTWVDFFNDSWWAVFSHYERFKAQTGKGVESTVLVQLDKNWKEVQSWTFPDTIIEKFKPMSNSGGSWGPNGNLYCTGHDLGEVYVLSLPKAGSVLLWKETISIDNHGQGIAWDRSQENILYWINRKEKTAGASKLISK